MGLWLGAYPGWVLINFLGFQGGRFIQINTVHVLLQLFFVMIEVCDLFCFQILWVHCGLLLAS